MTNNLLSQAKVLMVSNTQASDFPLLPQSLLNILKELQSKHMTSISAVLGVHTLTESRGEAARSEKDTLVWRGSFLELA